MSFKTFKKNSQSKTNIEKLQEKLESMNKKKSYVDERFWYPARDKATKKGSAIIRFLPIKDDDSVTEPNGDVITTGGLPWVKTYGHSWKNKENDRWYIEECPTTVGLKCPLCDDNSELWSSGSEANQNLARDRKRRLTYIANVLVVSDPATPENEGKVFLYRFGQKIYDMIQASISPEFDDQEPVDVFNMWTGANFALRIGQKDGWTNYDKSEFLAPSAISDDDSVLEEIYDSLYCLSEFIAPSRFKLYEDLKSRLDYVYGANPSPKPAAEQVGDESDLFEDSSNYNSVDESDVDVETSDEKSEFFQKLANGFD